MSVDLELADQTLRTDIDLYRRPISDQELQRFEGYVAEIFAALGLDLNSPATQAAPRRFVQTLFGAREDADDPRLLKVFHTKCRNRFKCHPSQLIEGPIRFLTLCERHAVPSFGYVYVGCIASEKIISIAELARIVSLFAKRFIGPETMRQQIADTLQTQLHPHGIAVHLQVSHPCHQTSKASEFKPTTHATTWRGDYAKDSALQAEFFKVCVLHPSGIDDEGALTMPNSHIGSLLASYVWDDAAPSADENRESTKYCPMYSL